MTYPIDTSDHVLGRSEHLQTPIDWSLVPWRMPAIDTSRSRHELVQNGIAKADLLPTASIIEHVVRHLRDRRYGFTGRDLPDREPGLLGFDHRRTLVWRGGGIVPKPPALNVECADMLEMEVYIRIGGGSVFLKNGSKEVCNLNWTFPSPYEVPRNATATARSLVDAFDVTMRSSKSDTWMGSLLKAGNLAGQALSSIMKAGEGRMFVNTPRQGCPMGLRIMESDMTDEKHSDVDVAIHPAVIQAMTDVLEKPLYSTGFLLNGSQMIILNDSPVIPIDMDDTLDTVETLRLFGLTGGAPLAMDARHDPGRPKGDRRTWLMPSREQKLFDEVDVDRSL
jgi:hypothetical protein